MTKHDPEMAGGYRFLIDDENASAEWWDTARQRGDLPAELGPLLNDPNTHAVIVLLPRAESVARWCEAIPGWNDPDAPDFAPHPLMNRRGGRFAVWLRDPDRGGTWHYRATLAQEETR